MTGADSTSTLINNILHSLFTKVDASLNGKIITLGTDTYLYKAYLKKNTILQAQNLRNSNKSLYPVGERHDRTHGQGR